MQNKDIIILFIITILALLIPVLIVYVIIPYIHERKYIKMEIARSTGKEKWYWERKLKRLFFDFFFKK